MLESRSSGSKAVGEKRANTLPRLDRKTLKAKKFRAIDEETSIHKNIETLIEA